MDRIRPVDAGGARAVRWPERFRFAAIAGVAGPPGNRPPPRAFPSLTGPSPPAAPPVAGPGGCHRQLQNAQEWQPGTDPPGGSGNGNIQAPAGVGPYTGRGLAPLRRPHVGWTGRLTGAGHPVSMGCAALYAGLMAVTLAAWFLQEGGRDATAFPGRRIVVLALGLWATGGPGGGRADNPITTRTRAPSRSRTPAWDGRRFGRPPPGPAGLDSLQRLAHLHPALAPVRVGELPGRRRHGWQLLRGAAATPRRRSHLTGSNRSPSLHVSHPRLTNTSASLLRLRANSPTPLPLRPPRIVISISSR